MCAVAAAGGAGVRVARKTALLHDFDGWVGCGQPENAPARSQGHALLDRERRARQLEVRARVLFSPEPEPEPEPKSNLDGTEDAADKYSRKLSCARAR